MRQYEISSMHDDGFHKIAIAEWGDEKNNDIIICAHGLTLNGRYFDWFAKAAQDHYRILCPDTVGRGKSSWLPHEKYWFDVYTADAAALLTRLDTKSVNWIGTSMGGLIGIMLAAKKNHPIKRLILNDVGPFVSGATMQTIANYIGKDERFNNHDEVEAHLRLLYPKFGNLTDVQWRHLARIGAKMTGDGNLRLAYDPAIKEAYKTTIEDFDIWDQWEKINIPVLILRGSESGILTESLLAEMLARNPNARSHVFEGIGHAPPLMAGDQIDVILDFLAEGECLP